MTVPTIYEEPLQPGWLDAYGHLNEGYFLVPFGNANWHYFEHHDIGSAYFKRTQCAFYTVESHIRYLREVRYPALIQIEFLILSVDAKRFHIGLIMKVDGIERATLESMQLHIDAQKGRTAAMPEDVRTRLQQSTVAQLPDWSGRSISVLER